MKKIICLLLIFFLCLNAFAEDYEQMYYDLLDDYEEVSRTLLTIVRSNAFVSLMNELTISSLRGQELSVDDVILQWNSSHYIIDGMYMMKGMQEAGDKQMELIEAFVRRSYSCMNGYEFFIEQGVSED